MEACIDIAISGSINLIVDIEKGEVPMDTAFQIINSVALFVLYTATMAFPVFILAFYACKFAKWKDEDFDSKYGAIFEGLRKDRRSSLFYPFFFAIRRIILTVTVILTAEYLFVQLICQLLTLSIHIWYLTTYEPFEEPLLQKLEVFNELTMTGLIYCVMSFSPLNQRMDANEIWLVGVFLAFLCLSMLVHLYFLMKDSYLATKQKYKRRCCSKTKKKNGIKAGETKNQPQCNENPPQPSLRVLS